MTIDGVVELPQADSLFQKVGAPPQSQLQAPPDNVVLLPSARFQRAFGPLAPRSPGPRAHPGACPPHASAARRPGRGVHTGDHRGQQPRGPHRRCRRSSATTSVRRSTLPARTRCYSQILFLFLGLPGAALAAALTAVIAGAGAVRRRREQALLRTRGGSRLGGAAPGAGGGGHRGRGRQPRRSGSRPQRSGRIVFGSPGFGTTPASGASGRWSRCRRPGRRDRDGCAAGATRPSRQLRGGRPRRGRSGTAARWMRCGSTSC